MFRIDNAPTVPAGEDEIAAEVDEPPDQPKEKVNLFKKEVVPKRPGLTGFGPRRESLLTKAILLGTDGQPTSPQNSTARGLSTTSSISFASTAELTSDVESPIRSASPSPPPPPVTRPTLPLDHKPRISFAAAPVVQNKPAAQAESGEQSIEKTLGRKRCIMFACKDANPEPPSEVVKVVEVKTSKPVEEPARKPRISFACAMEPVRDTKLQAEATPRRQSSPVSLTRQPINDVPAKPRRATEAAPTKTTLPSIQEDMLATTAPAAPNAAVMDDAPIVKPGNKQYFHEFASSQGEVEDWVNKDAHIVRPKLTIDDCLKKENAIRRLGKEAEEEAEEEEREQDEMDEEENDEDQEDDFAPSDSDHSDDGNESDDENGFADSDDESDTGSNYQFWTPGTANTARASSDALPHFSTRLSTRSRASSCSSTHSAIRVRKERSGKTKRTMPIKMRPGTPELPDSTDFVCGTFDEDRPLEEAYKSCVELRRKEKLVPIPQDIDPSFPTSDPEAEEDEVSDCAESSDQRWVKNQFEGFDEDHTRRRSSADKVSVPTSDRSNNDLPKPTRSAMNTRGTARSPPPRIKVVKTLAKSPAPARRLFDQPKRFRSPPPDVRLRSPRGSPTHNRPLPFGITINRLAQRPSTDKTSSLPHTPNPFFRNWQKGSQPISRVTSAAQTPGVEEMPPDMHVRGPVDIVIGLERKRQKRKEKYWRQTCRKNAQADAERKIAHGQGVKRMKELGLECADRKRGYGLNIQPAQVVLSL